MEHIMNKDILKVFKVAPIPDKMRKARPWWYRHVVRVDVESITKQTLALNPNGWWSQEQQKNKWMNCLHEDMQAVCVGPTYSAEWKKWVGEMQNCRS